MLTSLSVSCHGKGSLDLQNSRSWCFDGGWSELAHVPRLERCRLSAACGVHGGICRLLILSVDAAAKPECTFRNMTLTMLDDWSVVLRVQGFKCMFVGLKRRLELESDLRCRPNDWPDP